MRSEERSCVPSCSPLYSRWSVWLIGLVVVIAMCPYVCWNMGRRNQLSPLHGAVVVADVSRVKRLIAEGADVNALDSHRTTTPLGVAAAGGYLEIMDILLDHGADVNKGAPLYYAARKGHQRAVMVLLENGADPNRFVLEDMPSPVVAAVEEGHHEILDLLVAAGARVPEVSGGLSFSLVHRAAVWGHHETVARLISLGHNCDLKDCDGDTALHIAARKGHRKVVETLIANGADVNLTNNDGKTPLGIARERGDRTIVELLQKHVAHSVSSE